MLSEIFDLFSTLVSFEYKKYTSFDHDIYQALPQIIVDFAYWSRVGTGFRLIKRCARNVVDPNMADISDVSCRLFSYKNEVGIEFGSDVAASMKGCTYCTNVAFTATKLLCCGCSCEIGARNDERITCVHNLPLILKMSLLLMDGLAENLLLELSALMVKSPEKCTLIKTGSIINLMFAAGEEVLDGMEEMKIQDLLNTFAVGTEKRKRSPGAPDQ